MSIQKYNLHQLHRTPGARLETTLGGAQIYSVAYEAETALIVQEHDRLLLGEDYRKLVPSDPGFHGLALASKRIAFDVGDVATLILSWEGVTAETLPPALWTVVRTPSEEPIEAHPRFSSFAGTASTPQNGAAWDQETGMFIGFPGDAGSGLAGVSKYLCENIVVTKNYVAIQAPDDSFEIPIIRWPTIHPGDRGIRTVPSIPLGFNWMQTDLVYTRRGNVYEVSEEYTASGANGWNNVVYPSY